MYAVAFLMLAGSTAAASALPYFHLGALNIGIPIQWFGMIVAAGVMIGATPLRRYAEWHGVADDHIRSLLTWVMISGFLGAHEFDVIAYQWDKLGDATIHTPSSWWFLPVELWPSNWPLPLRIWDGISSYGGFIGGALGYFLFVWWKRLPMRLFADITAIGLLPAFTIGRIGCTVVSDHIGATVEPDRWYAFLAMNYPSDMLGMPAGTTQLAWNLGLIEFLYLVPVNIVVLWLAFRPSTPRGALPPAPPAQPVGSPPPDSLRSSKRMPAGFVTVLTGVLYAPVRFFLDFLRPEKTDPRYGGLTFAQWSSILAFGVALWAASRILRKGVIAETVAPTSREAQQRLRSLHREAPVVQKPAVDKQAEAERKQAAIAQARAERDREDAELEAAERARAAKLAVDAPTVEVEADSALGDAAPIEAAGTAQPAVGKPAVSKPAGKPGVSKPPGGKAAGSKSTGKTGGNKNRKR